MQLRNDLLYAEWDVKPYYYLDAIFKICSQRIFLLKQRREQGMPLDQLHTVFQAIILNRLTYAILVWGPYLNVELKQRIDAFLKRSFRYGFSKQIFEIQTFIDSTMHDLFSKIKAPNHCLTSSHLVDHFTRLSGQ